MEYTSNFPNIPSMGSSPIGILDALIKDYVQGFQGYQNVGENRLRDQVQLDLVKRGIQGDATGVDILNRNLNDYTAQQNASLGQSLVPLYTAMASLAQNAMEAEAARNYNSQFAKEQVNNQLDFLGRRIPIDSQAYRTAFLLEKSLNPQHNYMSGGGGLGMLGGGGVLGGEYKEGFDLGADDPFWQERRKADKQKADWAEQYRASQLPSLQQDTFDLTPLP